MDDSTILMVRRAPDERYSVVIEDDGRVAYAYLRCGEEIVADVWLYNRCAAPQEPEWKDRSRLPFANPVGFSKENEIGPIRSDADVNVQWDDGTARVYLHGRLWAILRRGEKPGCCLLATKSGPLAKPLENA